MSGSLNQIRSVKLGVLRHTQTSNNIKTITMKNLVLVLAVLVSSFGFGQAPNTSTPGSNIANDVGNYMANSPTFYRGEAKFTDLRGILETILTNPQLAKKMIMDVDPAILDVRVWGDGCSLEPAEQRKTLPRFGDVIDAIPAIMAKHFDNVECVVSYICDPDSVTWKAEYIRLSTKDYTESFVIQFCWGNGTDYLVSVAAELNSKVLTKAALSKYQN